MKKNVSFLLAVLMVFSLFAFVSCGDMIDEQAINDAADLALELIEALPDATDAETSDGSLPETLPAPVPITETEQEQETLPDAPTVPTDTEPAPEPAPAIDENGSYDDKESVALYIHTYGRLPNNYISKNEAENLGWEGGSVERYAAGKCIGGSKFGNYEGLLPKKDGRQYYECDIDTLGENSRGAKRIVYSNDGLIYYTDDHYETFELLYGEE